MRAVPTRLLHIEVSPDPRWLTSGEMRMRYNITETTLRRWTIKRGFPHHIKLTSHLRARRRWRAVDMMATSFQTIRQRDRRTVVHQVHVAGQLGSSSIRESPFAPSEYTHSIDQIA